MLNSIMSDGTKADNCFAVEVYSVSHAIANASVIRIRCFAEYRNATGKLLVSFLY
jgi:hypothetical protein